MYVCLYVCIYILYILHIIHYILYITLYYVSTVCTLVYFNGVQFGHLFGTQVWSECVIANQWWQLLFCRGQDFSFILFPAITPWKEDEENPTPQDYLYQVTAKYLYYLVSAINIRVSMYTPTICSSVVVVLKRMKNYNFLKCSNGSFSKFKKDFAPDFSWL